MPSSPSSDAMRRGYIGRGRIGLLNPFHRLIPLLLLRGYNLSVQNILEIQLISPNIVDWLAKTKPFAGKLLDIEILNSFIRSASLLPQSLTNHVNKW